MSHSISLERADRIRRLFDAVLDVPRDERAPYLDEHCPDDLLRNEVESLLDALEHVDHVMGAGDPIPMSASSTDPSGHSPIPGLTLARYQIQEQLGMGGMGVVYRARDTKLDRDVALKFLPPHLSLNEGAKARLIHEAKAASALDHPNICTVYDIDETDDGRVFIAMAYYSGETLKTKIKRGPLGPGEALGYAIQTVSGLKKAHEAGIVHRDVKPSNIMVTEQERVRVVDFGIAKIRDVSLTEAGSALGTAAYMSPEQAKGRPVDQRADLWSVGVVLYEMLVGERPFQLDSPQAVIYRVLNRDFGWLSRNMTANFAAIVHRCLQKERDDRYPTSSLLLGDLQHLYGRFQADPARRLGRTSAAVASPSPAVDRSRICISYRRGGDPDDRVAATISDALSRHHDVSIDKSLPLGIRWSAQVESELARSDFLIVLLSARSIHSEMILAEIETAHRLAQGSSGRPTILPVRLDYTRPFAYPLSAYLEDLDSAYWSGENDTPRLIEQLTRAVAGQSLSASARLRDYTTSPDPLPEPLAAAQPHLETPEGTMDPHSAFYVQRPQDDIARRTILQQGVTLTIKGPRQMGKSSLLVRTMNTAELSGKQVVFLDFQLFNQSALDEADTFFKQFCVWLTVKLKLKNRVEEYWNWPLGNSQCCTLYMEDCILGAVERPLVLAMDEVERVFDTPFRSDFFGMLRSWHNDRATSRVWKQLDLALITSTEPYQLIENLNQSPFNVGEIVDVNDFTPTQVMDLNGKYGAPLAKAELEQLTGLLGGHPYLTRKALYLIASGQFSLAELLASATNDRGPFGDHLRYHLFRLHGNEDLIRGLRQVIQRRQCEDEAVFWRLQGAGLVLREDHKLVPRCRLYEAYFREHIDG